MIRAILVCVDYEDLLAITLPYNRHHFADVCIVTDTAHEDKVRNLDLYGCDAPIVPAKLFVTDAFYENGAAFNKWLALERALDWYGREGWLCIMDADVIWPKRAKLPELKVGCLYTPRRRMCNTIPVDEYKIPPETSWGEYPRHPNGGEFAGYSQVFHASDPVLGNPPWHEVDWKHAGGADSFFQRKWSVANKIRPGFDVLHFGPAGMNWMGRCSPYADGSLPEGASRRRDAMTEMFRRRRVNGGFASEKVREHPHPGQ
jgi:hypothetical protein